jgi:hypothetical protein
MNELVTIEKNPLLLIQAAIDKGVKPDEMGKMLDFVERLQENQAKQRFAEAMTAFQKRCPKIVKGRLCSYEPKDGGRAVEYKWASLDDVMNTIQPLLSEHGIVITFDANHVEMTQGQGPMPASMAVTCRIRVGTYFEDHHFACPIPANVKVNAPQQYGMALSYAKRYCLCAALHIVHTDQDNDAATMYEYLDDAQVRQINDMLIQTDSDASAFLRWIGAESVDKIVRKDLAKAVDALKRKQKKRG